MFQCGMIGFLDYVVSHVVVEREQTLERVKTETLALDHPLEK